MNNTIEANNPSAGDLNTSGRAHVEHHIKSKSLGKRKR